MLSVAVCHRTAQHCWATLTADNVWCVVAAQTRVGWRHNVKIMSGWQCRALWHSCNCSVWDISTESHWRQCVVKATVIYSFQYTLTAVPWSIWSSALCRTVKWGEWWWWVVWMRAAQVGWLSVSAGSNMVLFFIDQMNQVNSDSDIVIMTVLWILFQVWVLFYSVLTLYLHQRPVLSIDYVLCLVTIIIIVNIIIITVTVYMVLSLCGCHCKSVPGHLKNAE